VITDEQDQVVWVNKAFEAHTGYLLEEIMGQKPKDFLSGIESNKTTLNKIGDNLQEKNAFSIELVNYNKAGQPYWVQIDCTPYHDPISNKVGYMAIQTVITERKRYEQLILEKNVAFREIARISSHDVRRPLSSIMGLVKLIESGLNQQELAECLHLLNLSAGELDSLIHDIHKHIVRIEKQVDLDPHQLNTAENRIHQKTEII
jgi:PAS domain S-box-containing protein